MSFSAEQPLLDWHCSPLRITPPVLYKPPAVKFKDLEAVTTLVKYNTLPMRVRADYIPVTGASVLTFITIQFDRKDLQFRQKEGVLPPR